MLAVKSIMLSIMGWDAISFMILLLIFISTYLSGKTLAAAGLPLVLFILAVIFRALHEKTRQEFVSQLKSHRRELRAGATVRVDNMLLRYQSEITSYVMTVGILFTTVTIHSHYRRAGEEHHTDALFYSLLSFLLGWWAINGPLNTIQALAKNLHGGEKTTIALLIDRPLVKKLEEVEKKAAQV